MLFWASATCRVLTVRLPSKKGDFEPEIFYVVNVLLSASIIGEDLLYAKERTSSKKGIYSSADLLKSDNSELKSGL